MQYLPTSIKQTNLVTQVFGKLTFITKLDDVTGSSINQALIKVMQEGPLPSWLPIKLLSFNLLIKILVMYLLYLVKISSFARTWRPFSL